MEPDPDDLLQLLFRLEGLDRLPRTGFLQRGVADAESVAEHSFHVATLAWVALSAPGTGAEEHALDRLRVLELALLHDAGEALLGDLPRPAQKFLPEGAKAAAERRALERLLLPVGEHGRELAAELAAGETLEARFVSACDRLQLLIKTALYKHWNEGASAQFFEDLWAAERRRTAGEQRFATIVRLQDAVVRWARKDSPGEPSVP